ncbi:MAG: NAD(P)-dependent glycerol-3-phosphate dehydrogenase [Lachnospiraceae bacterium]|nr:NAD(P)-dependent glycerol-3-phosphate dehydrogenase [Lachnospiraceae bacterium]
MAKIGVVGAGSWGIALAVHLADKKGHAVKVWSCIGAEIDMLNEKREHVDKLPGVKLSENISFTKDLAESIMGMDLVILAVPSVFTRSTAKQMKEFVEAGQIILSVGKGIEENSLKILTEVIKDEIPQCETAVLCGPSHAEEVGRGLPTTIVAGSTKKAVAEKVQMLFHADTLRVYISPDVLGMELGGALKNVIALAAGISDGLGFGDNTKAGLITRGIAEITRLGIAMGGKAETFYGLTGIGDLIVTCDSLHSRNRKAGFLMGQGKTMQEAMDEVKMVVEGVYSAKAAKALADKYGVEMPLVDCVNSVLFGGVSAKEAATALVRRDSKPEHEVLEWTE